MLSKKAKDELKSRGIDIDKLVIAHNDPTEQEFKLGEITGFHSDDDLQEAITNAETAAFAKSEKNYGEKWGRDMNTTHKLGLSTGDAKDQAKVIAAMQAKAVADAKIDPDTKVLALTKDLDILRAEVDSHKNKAIEFENKYKQREIDDIYDAAIPKNRLSILEKDEHIARAKKFVGRDEKGYALDPKTGEQFKDKKALPVKFEDKVKEVYETNKWIEEAEPAGAAKGKAGFHHSTGDAVRNTTGKGFDHDKVTADLRAKYDMSDPEQRQLYQQEYTTLQVNANKPQ